MGGLFVGVVGCYYTFSAQAVDVMESALCIMDSVNSFYAGMFCNGFYSDVVLLEIPTFPIKVAFVAGIVVGANYMKLVDKHKNKK